MNKGLDFEKKVEKLFVDLKKKQVQHDVHIRDKGIHSQFDLRYGSRKKYYVECKFRSEGNVSFSDVAKFSAKLYLHNISYKKGVMITNQSYDKRSIVYSKKRGLSLIDGDDLLRLEKKSRSFWRTLF